ncbi:TRAP transporter small permease subunit [Comamonas antarctica]|uniref:TRAP transporter small permease protein n=1 Tax=Comamonas antarctica TaxID=2743470 RepID=A0A6N1X0S4_9BURK|nr:TRAP transporter small permease [Comamonas antarctica]QKV51943.1 TRAP transporter small permease subunit [Comamonas antarctica]
MKITMERCLSIIFGLIFLGLSVVVALETVLRKLFNVSLQGADELGGYALAIGATLAFTVALIGRSHVRVDVLLVRFPRRVQSVLNCISAVCLMGFSVLLAVLAGFTLQDSREYQSVSQTPWATPLAYPQALWLLALAIFAVLASWQALNALRWLWRRDWQRIDAMLAPRSAQDEVQDELEDLRARSGEGPGVATPGVVTPGVATPGVATADAASSATPLSAKGVSA